MKTIFDAVSNSRQGIGKVYAQDQSGSWRQIFGAKSVGFVLYVQGEYGQWFIPQQWDTDSNLAPLT